MRGTAGLSTASETDACAAGGGVGMGGKTARRNVEAAAARGCCAPAAKARSTSRVHSTAMTLGAHRDVGRVLLVTAMPSRGSNDSAVLGPIPFS